MSVMTAGQPAPVSVPPRRTDDLTLIFLPSAELGDQLQHLRKVQAEIDRRQEEELARLREIQDRD